MYPQRDELFNKLRLKITLWTKKKRPLIRENQGPPLEKAKEAYFFLAAFFVVFFLAVFFAAFFFAAIFFFSCWATKSKISVV